MSLTNYEQKASATDTVTAGAFGFDTVGGTDYGISKICFGAIGTITYVTASAGLPVAQQGTWTVELGATDNAVLDAIAASVALGSTAAKQPALGTAGTPSTDVLTVQGHASMTALKVDGSAVTQPVSGSVTANIGTVGTLATAAKQDTGNTSLATLAGAVAGTEMQVDIVSMPSVTISGTVTVGSHAVTNAGVFAVQVDGAALTSLQLLDDSVATVGAAIVSKGMAAVGTDGTNARILKTDTNGELQIDVLSCASHPVTNAGTFLVQENGAALTALQLIDDTVGSGNDANALNKYTVIGAYDAVNSGNVSPLQIDVANGGLKVSFAGQTDNVAVNLNAGTNTIGKLAANSGVTIGAVEIAAAQTLATVTTVSAVTAITNALPAGTNLLGRTSSSDETSTIYNGTTALTPKFAAIAASSSGNNTVIAAVTSKKIRVLAYNIIGNGAVNAKWQSGASGTDLTGLKYIAAAGGGICANYNPVGWFESASGVLLNLNLSGAVAVGGEIVYVEI